MEAEVKGLHQGLRICKEKGFTNIVIELDSLVLVQIIQGKVKSPWNIAYMIRSIFQLLGFFNYSVQHIFREGNQAADFLANVGCKSEKYFLFDNVNIPKMLRGIVRIDSSGLPSLRKIK